MSLANNPARRKKNITTRNALERPKIVTAGPAIIKPISVEPNNASPNKEFAGIKSFSGTSFGITGASAGI